MSYRETIAAHIIRMMPDDVPLFWDNITAHTPRQQTPFITISIFEKAERQSKPYFYQGTVSFTISAPMGTGPQFHDNITGLIRQYICFTTIGFLSLLDRRVGSPETIGGFSHVTIEVDFIQYAIYAYG